MNESTKSYMFSKLFSSLFVFSGGLHRCFSKEKEERDSWHLGHHREQNENSKYLWNWWVRLNFMQESDVWYIKQRDSMLLYNRSQMTSKCSENKEVVQELLGITNWRLSCKKGVYRILADFHFLPDRANFWQTDLFWHEKHRSVIVTVDLRFVLQK